MVTYEIAQLIDDALAVGLDRRELAARLRAAADRLEAEHTE